MTNALHGCPGLESAAIVHGTQWNQIPTLHTQLFPILKTELTFRWGMGAPGEWEMFQDAKKSPVSPPPPKKTPVP